MSSPKYLSPQQFSDLSGLSIATVRRYLKAGMLSFVQPAGPRGRILIQSDALAVQTTPTDITSTPHFPSTQSCNSNKAADAQRRSGPLPRWMEESTP
jgi:hypothetical protein